VQARHGVLAALGNVDLIEMVEPLEQMGVRMLVNQRWRLDRDGESIAFVGVDDPHDFGCDDLAGALRGAPSDEFRILLVHSPEIVPEAAAGGISLYLCGHTHGGQVCLPLVGPLRRNANCDRRFTSGLWRQDAMSGFTTRGVGVTGIPVRFGCPPEIAMIRLRRVEPREL